jgi:Rrf2 family iron-sulfur cluster assembly transcriptional regulator
MENVMKLTTKGRYAVTAMLDLALNDADEPVSLADISERQDISLSYLEQLFSKLRKAGLVVSMRGPGGGYRLKADAKDIPIAEIISAVDENIDATRCGGMANCQSDSPCLTHNLWADLSDQIRVFLSEISLEDMKSRAGELRKCSNDDDVGEHIISLA